jgi:RimJ/RimL family protein N-acetyltransferase
MSSPIIETDRLVLRRPSLDDLDRWAEMMADAVTAQFIGGTQPKNLVWRSIVQTVGMWELTGISMFSVIDKRRNVWIGRIGPWQPHGWPGPEIGWGLHPDAWGQGFGFEAAVASMNYAFGTLGWTRVIHCINPGNARSQALAKRLGSRVQGETKMPPPMEHETVELWGQTREEWVARAL